MATSSLLGGEHAPRQPSGNDLASLGPSDNTDSGSDALGAYDAEALASDTDASGTGERSSVDAVPPRPDADILPDHLERAPDTDALDDDVADASELLDVDDPLDADAQRASDLTDRDGNDLNDSTDSSDV